MDRQPSRVVLALATRGALSFETRVLFGQLGFALPPHGPRSPTAKGMESKGLRETRAIQEDVASFAPGRANRDEHLRVEDDEEALRRSAVALVPAHAGRRCRIVRTRLIQRTLGRTRRRSVSVRPPSSQCDLLRW